MEFDLHVWKKAEDADTVAFFTVSEGRRALCVDAPLEVAVEAIRARLAE